MERFAIKISDDLRSNLYNICRLCGIDNPTKIKILDSFKIANELDEEPCLSKKIENVVGIKVKRNDQMPQTICTLCVDKINDFFEYREMCGATNIQTRKLLGIPLDTTKRKKSLNDKEIKVEGESILGLGVADEDITDSKLSIKQNSKQTKHRVKSRAKKRGNHSKKKVTFKDEDVKLESDEIKVESTSLRVNNKTYGKRLKVDVKKKVDPTPLLTLKEPNKRERRREIDAQKLERRRIREQQRKEIEEKKREIELAKQILEQKKLEKKRKSRSTDQEPTVKKVKLETDISSSRHSCSICSETFSNNDLLTTHLLQSHTVNLSSYGCSSCAESFKTINEEKDHELWHSLSKTSYICPICNVAFDKTSIFTRHISLCKPFTLTPNVPNIRCQTCSDEFLTQNLYQWHACFIKPNGKCWHCNRIFVKASTLFKHMFKCMNNPGIEETPLPTTVNTVTKNHKGSKKSKTNETSENHIKSEPEANLDIDMPTSTNILSANMLPVVVLTKSIFKPNQTVMVHNEDMPFVVKTENEIDLEDQSQLEDSPLDGAHLDDTQLDDDFRDGDDSDDNINESENVNGFQNAMDTRDSFSDDDVIFIETTDEPVIVNGSPSATRTAPEKPFVLPIVIKREPIDTYEVVAPPMFDPNKKIKSEPLDGNVEVCNEPEKEVSPRKQLTKSRKTKKPNAKAYKDRDQLIQIKEEPNSSFGMSEDIPRTVVPTPDLGSAVVSLPTTNLLEATIKKEPIRPGYNEDFDPVLAMNIKKEPGLDDSSPSKMPLPSLRLRISKKHGTLNAKLISEQNVDDPQTSPKPVKIKRVKEKRLYKKPALLAEKIRQEMIARMAKEKEITNVQDSQNSNNFTVPVIDRVLDATTINDLPLLQVKIEPRSPCHQPEDIIDTLPDQQEMLSNLRQEDSNEVARNSQLNQDIWTHHGGLEDSRNANASENVTENMWSCNRSSTSEMVSKDSTVAENVTKDICTGNDSTKADTSEVGTKDAGSHGEAHTSENICPRDDTAVYGADLHEEPTTTSQSVTNMCDTSAVHISSDTPTDTDMKDIGAEAFKLPENVAENSTLQLGQLALEDLQIPDNAVEKINDSLEVTIHTPNEPTIGSDAVDVINNSIETMINAPNADDDETRFGELEQTVQPMMNVTEAGFGYVIGKVDEFLSATTEPTEDGGDRSVVEKVSEPGELLANQTDGCVNPIGNDTELLNNSLASFANTPIESGESQQGNFDSIEEPPPPANQQSDDISNSYRIPDSDHEATFEAIDQMINTLPMSNEDEVEKENLQVNFNNELPADVKVLPCANVLSSKDIADEDNTVANSDTSKSNSSSDKISDSKEDAHCCNESQEENSNLCTETQSNEKVKTSDDVRMLNGDENMDEDLLKTSVNQSSDYELNTNQTLTTSAIEEQLNSLLEDISDDSLSCDIDLDDKTVDWDWESKLLGD